MYNKFVELYKAVNHKKSQGSTKRRVALISCLLGDRTGKVRVTRSVYFALFLLEGGNFLSTLELQVSPPVQTFSCWSVFFLQ